MNTEMKNRIFFGTLMIAVMLLVVFLSPLTRLLGFLAVGIACAWEYKTRLGEKDIPVAFWILVLFDIAAAVLAWTHQVLMGWPVLLGASVMLTMGYGVYEKSRGGVAAVYTLSGILYPGFLFSLVLFISQTSWWLHTLMLACLSTWVCDSAACWEAAASASTSWLPPSLPTRPWKAPSGVRQAPWRWASSAGSWGNGSPLWEE